MKWDSAQDQARDPVRTARREPHRDTTAEGMPEHDYPRRHLVEHRGNRSGVVGGSPHRIGRGGAPETGQVEGDGVDARGPKDGIEVPVVPPPPVQSQDPRRARAVRLAEQA